MKKKASICAWCQEPVVLHPVSREEDTRPEVARVADPIIAGWSTKEVWIHKGTKVRFCGSIEGRNEDIDDREWARPATICWAEQGDFSRCDLPVKPVDVEAGNYSCGRHMRNWLAEQSRREHAEEIRRRQVEEQRLREWKLEQQREHLLYVKATPFGVLLPDDLDERYPDRSVMIKVEDLANIIRGIVEKGGEDSVDEDELPDTSDEPW